MKTNNVILNPSIGDKVTFYVNAPLQNIGTTLVPRKGVVTKINRTTFSVKEKTGFERKISMQWHKNCTHIPKITK